MMRWLFLFLIFLNLFFYVWQKQQTTDAIQSPSEDNFQAPTIQLAKEHPELVKPHKKDQSAQTSSETKLSIKEPVTCLYIGGFTNEEQLTVINTYFKKIYPSIQIKTIKQAQVPSVELYINNNKTALEQLDELSINSLIILRGTLKGNLSLGIFADKTEYTDIEEALKNTTIAIKTQKLAQSAPSYWLQIPNSQRALLSPEKLRDLLKSFPTSQQELMSCQQKTKASD